MHSLPYENDSLNTIVMTCNGSGTNRLGFQREHNLVYLHHHGSVSWFMSSDGEWASIKCIGAMAAVPGPLLLSCYLISHLLCSHFGSCDKNILMVSKTGVARRFLCCWPSLWGQPDLLCLLCLSWSSDVTLSILYLADSVSVLEILNA